MTASSTLDERVEKLYGEPQKKARREDFTLPADIGTDHEFKRKIVWFNAVGFLILHLFAVYGVLLVFSVKFFSIVWALGITFVAGMGVTAGAHRYYSHRTYKATFAWRLAMLVAQTVAGQNCMYIWVRDHRQHHKYSDTDADPHNATRGFFFSHIGWLMSKKHPLVKQKGKAIDMSDLEADWLVMAQKKYYKPLYVLFAMILPIFIPMFVWKETLINSIFFCYFARYILLLNITWTVNSLAHLYGNKPYDRNMLPVESGLVSFISVGEGWHNYHHAFPWDYRAAEFGEKYSVTTMLLDLSAYLGLTYDLRSTSESMVKHRAIRTGDGTHPVHGEEAVVFKELFTDSPVELEHNENENEVDEKKCEKIIENGKPRFRSDGSVKG